MAESRIRVENLSKEFKLPHERHSSLKATVLNFNKRSFEKFTALKDISFEVKEGEFFGILGRNGSGKSTLLKLLAGIYTPTTGSVTVNGTLTPFIELGVGFNPELTGRENVYLNGAILGLTQKEMEAKYDEIVAFAELERFMDQKLKNYSSGMQVRLAFSIAIQAHNAILLIDEVLAVGDERFQNKCISIFNRIKKDPTKTVVFVSHDMGAVQRFCDRAIVIHDSRLIYEGEATGAVYEYKKLNFPEQIVTEEVGDNQAKNRWGSHKAVIESVELKEVRRQDLRNGIDVKMKIKVNDKGLEGKEVLCGLAFHDNEGNTISGPNSRGQIIRAVNGMITYHVPSHALNSGEYKVSTALFTKDDEQTLDYRDKQYTLSIAKTTQEVGPLVMGGEWRQDV